MLWTCSRDGHSGMLQWHWHWVDCRRAAFVQFWVADRSDNWSVLAFGANWVISQWQTVRCGRWRGNSTSAAGRLDRASRRRTTTVGLRLVALRVLRTTRAARQPFLFWIGQRARSGCAGPPGPRPLEPPRLRTRRRASGMMAASRGPTGPLRGSPLPRGHTAGWFGTT